MSDSIKTFDWGDDWDREFVSPAVWDEVDTILGKPLRSQPIKRTAWMLKYAVVEAVKDIVEMIPKTRSALLGSSYKD